MADARALLKARRQEARISHPHALYTSAGQLKCILCSAPVKFASAWEGHLGSKVHRTNLARLREEERQEKERLEQEQQLEEESHKRKHSALVDHDVSDEDEMDTDESRGSKKRRADSDGHTTSAGAFPQDFFSDPSRKPVPLTPTSDDEDEDENAMSVDPPKSGTTKSTSEIDLEYERFQRELHHQSVSSEDKAEKFERATVFAEPELATDHEVGFPAKDTEQAAVDSANAIPLEEEIRQKREEDERELIMDRLLDEERAQEDADNRVLQMKSRLEAIRKRKEGAKKQK